MYRSVGVTSTPTLVERPRGSPTSSSLNVRLRSGNTISSFWTPDKGRPTVVRASTLRSRGTAEKGSAQRRHGGSWGFMDYDGGGRM
jgi:hypothetical protein